MKIYATEIAPGLWQGPAPLVGPGLAGAGFDALVLSAVEYQPEPVARVFPGLKAVYRVPTYDEPLEPESALLFSQAAEWVVDQIQQGRKTLVTCVAGRNRSGLIAALVTHYVTGCSGAMAAQYVQTKIPEALSNDSFMRFLWSIKKCDPILRKYK